MKKNYKILISFFIIIFLLTTFSNASYYYNFINSEGNNIELVISDYIINNEFKFTILEASNHYYIYYSSDTFKIKLESGSTTIKTDNGQSFSYSLIRKDEVINYVLDFSIINSNFNGLTDNDGYAQNLTSTTIVYSNFIIYDLETGKELFPNAEEENEVNSISQILSFLNPFSDQFFGKKLVEFIIEGLKVLFIPEEGFFEEYFDSLKEFFTGRFGFLEYPITFFTNFVDRVENLGNNGNNTVINIPEIKVPVFDVPIISETSFDIGNLYYDETLTRFHLLYYSILKGITYFGLINLFMKKFNEVVQK